MNLVISTSELQSLYLENSDNLIVVDARPYPDYVAGHLPTAVNIDLAQFHWIDTSREGISQFNKQMKILISNIGITKRKFVVFYDDTSGISSARGVWLLTYFSHNKTAMLDGGFSNWKRESLEIETGSNSFFHSNFDGKPNRHVLAGYAYISSKIKKRLNSNNVVILDSRSKSEYRGYAVRAARGGHIPTAINVDWNDNIKKDGTFKEEKELEKLYSHIPKDKEVITYCQGGYRAANTFIVLRNMGYSKVRMYVGSWGEWGNKLDLPVERFPSNARKKKRFSALQHKLISSNQKNYDIN
jgi:thiosulfate/3-mercaptopyruvate sulfurtransferase